MKNPVSTKERSSSAVSISLFGKESITVSETQTFLFVEMRKQYYSFAQSLREKNGEF